MTTRRAVFLDPGEILNEAVRPFGRAGSGHAASAALAARGIRPAHAAPGVLDAAALILERGGGPGHGPV